MSPRLSLADRLFVRLLTRNYARSVIRALERRPQRWVEVTGGIGPPSRRASLREWKALARETLRSFASSGAVCDSADVVHCEMAPNPEELRQSYYRIFLPDTRVDYVSQRSEICAGLPRLHTLAVLVGLLLIILLDGSIKASQITRRRVQIARFCFACLSHALASTEREAYLMRLYQPHIPILSAFLMDHGVRTNIVTNPGPMLPAEFAIPAERLVLTHPFQVHVALRWDSERMAKSLALWGPFNLPEILTAAAESSPDHAPSAVGIYTQGYWLRLREGSISEDEGRRLVALEEQLMNAVEKYLGAHRDAHAVHFPHPMERRHYSATGEKGPWRLVKHPRVESLYDGLVNSIETFHLVSVGITTLSTVAYDRLYAGYPAFFYVGGMHFEHVESDASIAGLILRSPAQLVEAVERVLGEGKAQFFADHFGGRLDEWQPDDRTLSMMQHYGPRTGGRPMDQAQDH